MEAVFGESAFRHGYSEADFYEVIASDPIKRRSLRGVTNVYELFGQNFAGDYLHILYRGERDRVVVFHMARMTLSQKKYYRRHGK